MPKKPMNLHLKEGALHKAMNISKNAKIPASKEAVKSTDTPLMKKRKQFAINAAKWNHGGTKKNAKK